MRRVATLRDGASPAPGARRHRTDASVTSMERALRTLTPTSSPTPQTPRPKNNGGPRSKKLSFKPTAATKPAGRASSDGEEAVKVAVRMRPLAPNDDQCAGRAWRAASEKNSIVELPLSRVDNEYTTPGRRRSLGESEYYYDRVFGEDSNTCEIYTQMVSDMVESVTKEGINGTVFTYGQTSSGKTFTMQGCASPDSSIGIIQLAAKDIFQSIKEEKGENPNTECSVKVSYVEIYNEELRDLLNNRRSSTSLIIREDKRGSISVEGLKEVAVNSLEQLMDVFRVGETNKSIGSTKMNDRSSRSHAILQIMLERKTVLSASDPTAEDKENAEGPNGAVDLVVRTMSALNLVDLAGSESVRHTGASGMQKKEGGMINQSLLTLSKVLMSLGQKNPGHINYRDSKLTRILKPSLSGNARMAVICCISPSDKYVEETRSTLQFATRAKLVKTNAVANEELEDADLIAKLRLESAKVRVENKRLEERLRQMERMNPGAEADRRELENLKKFMLSEKATPVPSRVVNRSLSYATEFYTDEHCTPSRSKLLESAMNNTSKDDLHVLSFGDDASSSSGGNILRAALDFKAKQVKSLQARLKGSKSKGKKRYSLTSDARSPGESRRYSMINEFRSPDIDRRISRIHEARSPRSKPQSQDVESEELESKLANANILVARLERQVDDLTSQKNDALDWIEELFTKSDQKDEKIRQAAEEKVVADKRCDKLNEELLEMKELLQSTCRELEQTKAQNERLTTEAEDAKAKMASLGSEQNQSADKVEELYLELASAKEKYEASHDSLQQARREVSELLEDQREADVEMRELKSELMQLKSEGGASNTGKATSSAMGGNVADLEKANEVLKSQVQELEDFASEYVNEKRALIEQIEKYEEDLSHADALLKAKSDELDDAMFSLDGERKKWVNEKNDLLDQMKGGVVAPLLLGTGQQCGDSRVEALTKENEKLRVGLNEAKNAKQALESSDNNSTDETNDEMKKLRAELDYVKKDLDVRTQKVDYLTHELNVTQRQLEDAVREAEEVGELREENENLRLKDLDAKQYEQKIDDLYGELSYAHRRIEEAKQFESRRANQEGEKLRVENARLRTERSQLENDLRECCQKMEDLSSELEAAQQQVRDKEKAVARAIELEEENSDLLNHLTDANSQIKQLHAQVQDTKHELNLLQKGKNEELRKSVSRIQQLVDALTSENEDLKAKNEGLERASESMEIRSHELQDLLSAASSERDVANDERNHLMQSNATLLTKFKKLSSERDAAVHEKDVVRGKLDKIAAEFEADYETVRSKIDNLLEEKKDLEDRIVFLEASKTSVESKGDRILERDNALAGQHDRLKSEYKKQAMRTAELEDEVKQLVQRLAHLKGENRQLHRDIGALKEMVQSSSSRARSEEPSVGSNGKRRVNIFGFMGNHK